MKIKLKTNLRGKYQERYIGFQIERVGAIPTPRSIL